MASEWKEDWKVASNHTNGVYKVIFKPGKNVNHDSMPLSKKMALGSGLVLGNIATLGLINLGILSYMRFRDGPTSRAKKKKTRKLYVGQKVREIMGAAVQRTPGNAPKAPAGTVATQYTMHVLGLGARGYGDHISDPAFLAWWQYFIDPNNFISLKQQLTTLINEEGLQQVI